MITWLTIVVIAITVLGALGGVVSAIANRPPGNLQFWWSFLAELAVLVQTVVGLVAIIGGRGPHETATAIAYLLAMVLFLPAAIWWALTDRTRFSGLVMTVAGLAVAGMSLRLLQIWGVLGG
jgi:hypothetical protein